MDISLANLVKFASEIGPIGLVLFFWWYDNRRIWIVFEQHKTDLRIEREQLAERTSLILEQYRGDMTEQREMYRANASLCRDFASVTEDLRNIVALNIQAMTRLDDAVRGNQFCPMIRISERKIKSVMPRTEDEQS